MSGRDARRLKVGGTDAAETDMPGARRRPPLALAALAVAALAAFAGFSALGLWQLERRTWKLDLIARVEARIHAPPEAAPGPAEWPAVSAATDEYRRVRLNGRFIPGRETLTQAATDLGAGYWVIAPFRTTEGFTVLVNRGFVSPERRDPATRGGDAPSGEAMVVGLLRISEPHGGFLRANEPEADRWRSRDVAAIAAARGLGEAAPYFVDADATPNPGGWPVGGLTVVAFRNSHLVYALTWFALALMVVGAAAIVARHEARGRRKSGRPR
jgi:surfeit locus 1 family protein